MDIKTLIHKQDEYIKLLNKPLNSDMLNYIEDLEQKLAILEAKIRKIEHICDCNDEISLEPGGAFNIIDCDKYKLGKHRLANKIKQIIEKGYFED